METNSGKCPFRIQMHSLGKETVEEIDPVGILKRLQDCPCQNQPEDHDQRVCRFRTEVQTGLFTSSLLYLCLILEKPKTAANKEFGRKRKIQDGGTEESISTLFFIYTSTWLISARIGERE